MRCQILWRNPSSRGSDTGATALRTVPASVTESVHGMRAPTRYRQNTDAIQPPHRDRHPARARQARRRAGRQRGEPGSHRVLRGADSRGRADRSRQSCARTHHAFRAREAGRPIACLAREHRRAPLADRSDLRLSINGSARSFGHGRRARGRDRARAADPTLAGNRSSRFLNNFQFYQQDRRPLLRRIASDPDIRVLYAALLASNVRSNRHRRR